MLLKWNLQPSFNFLLSFTSNIKVRSYFICSWHWLKDDFQNQRSRRAELISRPSGCNSSMHKCQYISLRIDCWNTSPWPHLALFLIHSTCSWPFFLQSDLEHAFSSGLGNGIYLLLCTFISFPVKIHLLLLELPKVRCQRNKLLSVARYPKSSYK